MRKISSAGMLNFAASWSAVMPGFSAWTFCKNVACATAEDFPAVRFFGFVLLAGAGALVVPFPAPRFAVAVPMRQELSRPRKPPQGFCLRSGIRPDKQPTAADDESEGQNDDCDFLHDVCEGFLPRLSESD